MEYQWNDLIQLRDLTSIYNDPPALRSWLFCRWLLTVAYSLLRCFDKLFFNLMLEGVGNVEKGQSRERKHLDETNDHQSLVKSTVYRYNLWRFALSGRNLDILLALLLHRTVVHMRLPCLLMLYLHVAPLGSQWCLALGKSRTTSIAFGSKDIFLILCHNFFKNLFVVG